MSEIRPRPSSAETSPILSAEPPPLNRELDKSQTFFAWYSDAQSPQIDATTLYRMADMSPLGWVNTVTQT